MQPTSGEPTTRAPRPKHLRLVPVELIGGAIAFGIAGHWTAPFVARVFGRATGHSDVLLRLIGWCFGGLPWVVIGVLVFTRPLLLVRNVIPHVLAIWVAINATVIPGRRSHGSADDLARRTFGAWAADGQPLSLGVGTGLLSVLVAFLGIGLVVKVLRGHGPFQHRSKAMTRAIEAWYFFWLAAGLVVALVVQPLGSG